MQADEQIHLRFDQMLQNCPLPVLYGLSFLGTSMRVYSGNVATGNIIPELIDNPRSGPYCATRAIGGEVEHRCLVRGGGNEDTGSYRAYSTYEWMTLSGMYYLDTVSPWTSTPAVGCMSFPHHLLEPRT